MPVFKPRAECVLRIPIKRIWRLCRPACLRFKQCVSENRAHRTVDPKTARKAFISIGPLAECRPAVAFQECRVLPADPKDVWKLAESSARGAAHVRAQKVRPLWAVTAEMEEAKRPALNVITGAVPTQLTFVQVPVGDIAGRIIEDAMLEQGWNEVDPALINE